MAMYFAIFNVAICKAVEPLTLTELRQAHAELRAASSNIEGEFRVFRSETAVPAALDELPTDLNMPLIKSGKVWRSKERFRADYKKYDAKSETATEVQHSVAISAKKVFEFSSANPKAGLLRIYQADAPQAAPMITFIETTFYQPLDSLWSSGSTAFVDLLQRPTTKIVPNRSDRLKGGYSLLVTAEDGSQGQYELEPKKSHPFGYFSSSTGSVKIERRVFSIESNGVVLPTRFVDVVSFSPSSAYTQVVMLNLKPLNSNSPVARDITPDDFRNLGADYQVYNLGKSGNEELGARYEARQIGPSSPTFRSYFMWANGFLIMLVLAYLFYRYGASKRRK